MRVAAWRSGQWDGGVLHLSMDNGSCTARWAEGDRAPVVAGSPSEALALALAGLDAGASQHWRPPERVTTITVPACVALLAAADALQSAQLRSRLARAGAWKPVLTAQVLEVELGRGLSSTDASWAVSAARRMEMVDVAAAAGGLEGGLQELLRIGLLSDIPRGFSFSQEGERLARALSPLRQVIHLAAASAGAPPHAAVSIFGGDAPTSSAFAVGKTNVIVTEAAWAAARESAVRLLALPLPEREPPPAPPPPAPPPAATPCCVACSTPARPDDRFCRLCGARIPEPPRHCPACGRSVPTANFCETCGARIR